MRRFRAPVPAESEPSVLSSSLAAVDFARRVHLDTERFVLIAYLGGDLTVADANQALSTLNGHNRPVHVATFHRWVAEGRRVHSITIHHPGPNGP